MAERTAEAQRDHEISIARQIIEDLQPEDHADAMLTLEGVVAMTLIYFYDTPSLALGMLNEGLLPGVERRLKLAEDRRRERAKGGAK